MEVKKLVFKMHRFKTWSRMTRCETDIPFELKAKKKNLKMGVFLFSGADRPLTSGSGRRSLASEVP